VFSPGCFYLRHVQKVDYQNTVFEITLENIFEYFLIGFVNQNLFLFRSQLLKDSIDYININIVKILC
jgi:hypothetical protein